MCRSALDELEQSLESHDLGSNPHVDLNSFARLAAPLSTWLAAALWSNPGCSDSCVEIAAAAVRIRRSDSTVRLSMLDTLGILDILYTCDAIGTEN